jgi:hypothetical protein
LTSLGDYHSETTKVFLLSFLFENCTDSKAAFNATTAAAQRLAGPSPPPPASSLDLNPQ